MVSTRNIFLISQRFMGLKTNSILQGNRTCTYCFFATIKLAISTFIGRIELEKCISGQGTLPAILLHNNLTDRIITFVLNYFSSSVRSQDNYVLVFTWSLFATRNICSSGHRRSYYSTNFLPFEFLHKCCIIKITHWPAMSLRKHIR